MAVTQFGVTLQGFIVKQQATIIEETQASLQAALGANINLLPQAVFGQIVGIFSEREALIWQLAEAVYASQYPAGAEGTSVDNILALNNLRRLPARATKTAPTNTAGTPGLILLGTPGTIIPVGSIISVDGNPSLQFTTDAEVTIAAAVNAVQVISLYGGAPSQGSFSLQIVDTSGNTLTTPLIAWNALAAVTQLTWVTPPSSGNFRISVDGLITTSLPFSASAGAIQTAIQALAGYSGVMVTGSPTSSPVLINWGSVSQPVVQLNATQIAFSANPSAGTFQISLNGTNVAAVAYNSTAATLQAAIRALAGFELVTVTGAATLASGFFINWGWVTPATVAIVANPTGATLSVVATYTLNQAEITLNSIQAAVNTLYDSTEGNYPYTDVTISGSLASAMLTATFGAGTVVPGEPVSSAQQQDEFTVPVSTLQNGTVVININAVTTAEGTPALAVASATATVTGPNYVPAGFLTVIGSPVSGWASVTNPLDAITGSNIETDPEALLRRAALLAAQANGPLQAIAEDVALVPGVIQAVGFENTSLAANQRITFNAVPSAGSFTITLYGPAGVPQTTAAIPYNAQSNVQMVNFSAVPPSGFFTLTFGAQTTGNIAYNATASAVQSAIRALVGYETAVATGSFALGFSLSFGQNPQATAAATNSLGGGVTITTIASVQSRVNDLTSYGPALITGSYAVGFVIAFNGSAGGQPQLLATIVNSLTGVVTIVVAFGLPGKAFEIVVNDNNGQAQNADIAQAIFKAKPAGQLAYGSTTYPVEDAFGNVFVIGWSRPSQVPIYINVVLTTDLTTSPNPKFNPATITTIQEDLVEIGQVFPIGGTVIGFGSGGLIGAFNEVPGITSYDLTFGTSPNPTQNQNIQLQPEQVAQFESFLVIVSYI